VGESLLGNGASVGGSGVAIGMVIVHCSHAMANGQLCIILLILSSEYHRHYC